MCAQLQLAPIRESVEVATQAMLAAMNTEPPKQLPPAPPKRKQLKAAAKAKRAARG